MHSLFSQKFLNSVLDKHQPNYLNAKPFPHAVIDGLFNEIPDALIEAIRKFPTPTEMKWYKYENTFEVKLATDKVDELPAPLRRILYELNSSRFVHFLELLTGIPAIIPDPHFIGGGLHQIQHGGKLDVHVDFNKHHQTNLDRRVNVLLYLNREWHPEYGGDLELWDADMKECQVKIAPLFGRMVIFNISDKAPHGHPNPLTCPEHMTRKSIATYYYTNGRPAEEVSDKHRTVYKKRPGDADDPEVERMREERSKGRLKDQTT